MARAVEHSARSRLYREPGPGERWWFALLVVPAVLTAVVVMTRGEAIESELEQDALVQLHAAGLQNTRVEMSGRNATLLVPTGEDEDVAVQATERVEGIGAVDVQNVAASAREAKACAELQAKIDKAGDQHGVAFAASSTTMTGSGLVAVRATGRLLVACPSATVVAEGHVDGSVLSPGKVSLSRAEVVRTALVRAGVDAARIGVKGFGNTYPASTEDTQAGRARNNRVVITVDGD